jgi:hypothetical protein
MPPLAEGFHYVKIKTDTAAQLKALKVFTDDGMELTTLDQKVFFLIKLYERSSK